MIIRHRRIFTILTSWVCTVQSFNSWSTVPLGVVVQTHGLNLANNKKLTVEAFTFHKDLYIFSSKILNLIFCLFLFFIGMIQLSMRTCASGLLLAHAWEQFCYQWQLLKLVMRYVYFVEKNALRIFFAPTCFYFVYLFVILDFTSTRWSQILKF